MLFTAGAVTYKLVHMTSEESSNNISAHSPAHGKILSSQPLSHCRTQALAPTWAQCDRKHMHATNQAIVNNLVNACVTLMITSYDTVFLAISKFSQTFFEIYIRSASRWRVLCNKQSRGSVWYGDNTEEGCTEGPYTNQGCDS